MKYPIIITLNHSSYLFLKGHKMLLKYPNKLKEIVNNCWEIKLILIGLFALTFIINLVANIDKQFGIFGLN